MTMEDALSTSNKAVHIPILLHKKVSIQEYWAMDITWQYAWLFLALFAHNNIHSHLNLLSLQPDAVSHAYDLNETCNMEVYGRIYLEYASNWLWGEAVVPSGVLLLCNQILSICAHADMPLGGGRGVAVNKAVSIQTMANWTSYKTGTGKRVLCVGHLLILECHWGSRWIDSWLRSQRNRSF